MNEELRWAIRRDYDRIVKNEIENSTDPYFAWLMEDYTRELQRSDAICRVIEVGRDIAAQMVYRIERRNLEVIRFLVAPQYRRCGYGKRLLTSIFVKLHPDRRESIVCEVPDYLIDLHLFLRACGFRAEGILYADDEHKDDRFSFVYHVGVPA